MRAKKLAFRAWYYFRQGWGTYFAFIFAAVNTLVTTYYLAIQNVPSLKLVFPTFSIYVGVIMTIGIPLLVTIGYIHFKKSAAFSSEQDVNAESNPYLFKLPPGYNVEVIFPMYLVLTKYLVKWSKNEKLTNEEINEITELQKKINVLIKGGFVGNPTRKPSHISVGENPDTKK
jgi:hypothetical protein